MKAPHVSPRRRTFSASRAVEVAGEVLREIKEADNLTYHELGEVIGKGADQAERIAKGNATMDMPTFLRACDYWGERFADRLLALVGLATVPTGTADDVDAKGSLCLSRLLTPVIEIEADGIEEVDELRPHEALIRSVHHKTQHWLEMIAGAAPAIRSVR